MAKYSEVLQNKKDNSGAGSQEKNKIVFGPVGERTTDIQNSHRLWYKIEIFHESCCTMAVRYACDW